MPLDVKASSLNFQIAQSDSCNCRILLDSSGDPAYRGIYRNSNKLGKEDQEFLLEFQSAVRGDLGSLRNSLHFALGITPLCLLMPYEWSKTTLNRLTLIKVICVLPPLVFPFNDILSGVFPLETGNLKPYWRSKI